MPESITNTVSTVNFDALVITSLTHTESTHMNFPALRLTPAPDSLAENRFIVDDSLAGLERWEAEHGLGRDDV